MCLSAYLGTVVPLSCDPAATGALGLEPAKHPPPPLVRLPYVYTLGRQEADGTLSCACMLTQIIDWDAPDPAGPVVTPDPMAQDAPECPFVTLRSLVRKAQAGNEAVILVSDDMGESPNDASMEDYASRLLHPGMIRPESHLFTWPDESFPWITYYVTAS